MAQSESFRDTVEGIWSVYSADMVSGDMDRWIMAWDEDGVQMPPDTPPRCGKATILKKMKADLQSVRYVAFDIGLEDAIMAGEFGIARGGYTYSFVRAHGSERNDRVGKYLTVFRRQSDGSWKIFRDCFNLDAPAR